MVRRIRGKQALNMKRRLFYEIRICYYCRQPLTLKTATLEHLKPLSDGGTNKRSNLTLCCSACNNERGVMPCHVFKALVRERMAARRRAAQPPSSLPEAN